MSDSGFWTFVSLHFGYYFKMTMSTTPEIIIAAPTGDSSHPRCYARGLKGCSSTISREHFISKKLLKYFDSHGELHILGMPWSGHDPMKVWPNTLGSKILCTNHNNVLSDLDDQATLFFDAFHYRREDENAEYSINGYDLERWLLKLMCGSIASKSFQPDSTLTPQIARYWLDILFLNERFPLDQGIYICNKIDHSFQPKEEKVIEVRAIANHSSQLSGIGVYFSGMEIVFTMSALIGHRFDGRQFAYRPSKILNRTAKNEQSVRLCWSDEADHGLIELTSNSHRD